MSIQIKLHRFNLKCRHTFTISRESRTHQEILIVELIEDGVSGFGETSANPYYNQTLETIDKDIQKVTSLLLEKSLKSLSPDELWQDMNEIMGDNPFALCALNGACYDLWGKHKKKPVYELLGLDVSGNCLSDVTLGIDKIETMLSIMDEWSGWPIFKIKLGTDHDLEIMQALCEKNKDAVIRIDANAAWSLDKAISMSHKLKDLNVEFIEQPMPADKWEDMKVLYKESALPCIADESCIGESDIKRCVNHFHGVNVKLTKCGGLTPAIRMLKEARSLGLKTMIGCMVESSIGISAIGHIVPLLDYVDMDGVQLLGEDIARGVSLDKGVIRYPDTPGLGIEPSADFLSKSL